jgi:hypothetical protein
VHEQYAKVKRRMEGGGLGQVLKTPKIEASADRTKGKGKSASTSFFPRFREYFYSIVNPGEAQHLYESTPSSTLVLEKRSYLNKQGNKRSNSRREVNPKETMATLLRLQILPNDHKATLDAYLPKLEGHIENLKDVLARILFAITHKVANAQLSRLTGLEND